MIPTFPSKPPVECRDKWFSMPNKQRKRLKTCLSLDVDTRKALDVLAHEWGMSRSMIVTVLVMRSKEALQGTSRTLVEAELIASGINQAGG